MAENRSGVGDDRDPEVTHTLQAGVGGNIPPLSDTDRWGDLRLLDEIGHGGFGRVYRAWDETLARDVAIKIIKPRDASHRASVLLEGQMLARVSHRNVVTVFRAQQVGDEVGLTMELIKGRHLSDLVRHSGPMGAEEASVIGISLCHALSAVHGAGLLHRDLKAHNVMRESGGRIVLMDFGAGRELGQLSEPRRDMPELSGTPLYLAPELFAGAPASPASDLYSLGVLLFFLVTGRYPVEGTSVTAIRLVHGAGERRMLSDLRPDLPDGFVRVVDRALSPRPEQRSRSAGAMAAELMATSDRPSAREAPGVARKGQAVGRGYWVAALVAAAVVGVLAVFQFGPWGNPLGPAAGSRRLAVLPFDAGDLPDVTHVAAGLSSDIRRALQRYGLEVKRVGQPMKPTDDVGTLGVDLLVAGSIARAGAGTSLIVRLVRPGAERPIWSHQYDESETTLPTVAQRAAQDLAQVLGISTRQRAPGPLPQVDYRAYDAYQRGRQLLDERSETSLKRSIDFFKQAADLDSSYAEPWAGLADAYIQLGVAAFGPLGPREARQRTRDAVTNALRRNPDLAEAETSNAFATFFHEWDWENAGNSFKKAIALNPQYAPAHHWYADFLTAMGRQAQAMDEIRKATDLEPLSLIMNRDVAWHLFFQEKYAEAVDQLGRTLLMNPTYGPALTLRARAFVELGRYAEAEADLAQVRRSPSNLSFVAYAQAKSGATDKATTTLREIQSLATSEYVPPYYIALVETALGRYDRALIELERGFVEPDFTMVLLNVDPRFKAIRQLPRFLALVQRMKFPKSGS